MTSFVALLRAVNVGGTGKLPMEDLRVLCADAGFAKVQTYIASGNVVFTCRKSETQVKAMLRQASPNTPARRLASSSGPRRRWLTSRQQPFPTARNMNTVASSPKWQPSSRLAAADSLCAAAIFGLEIRP
jgi:uncharacterized protein (DUF1697 family)